MQSAWTRAPRRPPIQRRRERQSALSRRGPARADEFQAHRPVEWQVLLAGLALRHSTHGLRARLRPLAPLATAVRRRTARERAEFRGGLRAEGGGELPRGLERAVHAQERRIQAHRGTHHEHPSSASAGAPRRPRSPTTYVQHRASSTTCTTASRARACIACLSRETPRGCPSPQGCRHWRSASPRPSTSWRSTWPGLSSCASSWATRNSALV